MQLVWIVVSVVIRGALEARCASGPEDMQAKKREVY